VAEDKECSTVPSTEEPTDDGKPTCCGPGDLSKCVIRPTKEKTEAQPRTGHVSNELEKE